MIADMWKYDTISIGYVAMNVNDLTQCVGLSSIIAVEDDAATRRYRNRRGNLDHRNENRNCDVVRFRPGRRR